MAPDVLAARPMAIDLKELAGLRRAINRQRSSEVLTRLLGSTPAERFFEHHFGAEPLLAKGAGEWACALASEGVCERLIADPATDVMFARDGQPFTGERPDLEGARRLFAGGYTWVLRDVDRGDALLAELGRTLASEVHGSLHLQLYRTPAQRFGFGWHFDPEEVFYVQTYGHKRVCLRRNTQHPAPLAARMPTWLRAEHEDTPVQEHLLEPGDVLYIPSGWWHYASALDDTVSISAGVRSPSVLDALELVLSELASDPKWRARLPAMGRASPLDESERQEAWRRAFAELDRELHKRLNAPVLPTRLFACSGWWRSK